MPCPVILVTGAAGQPGFELLAALRAHGDIVATDRARFDLADPDAIVAAVRGATQALIVNPGAYAAIDRAGAHGNRWRSAWAGRSCCAPARGVAAPRKIPGGGRHSGVAGHA